MMSVGKKAPPMTQYHPEQSTPPEIPVVTEGVFGALRHDRATDPTFDDRSFHALVESNKEFAHQIVIEANKRSGGKPESQFQFIQGALFAIAALQRQAKSNKLNELLGEPVSIDDAEPLLPSDGAGGGV